MAREKIILCFDGTCNDPADARCNDPADARQKKNLKMELKDNSISNIFKLHLLLGGGVSRGDARIDSQQSFYYSGVGTYGNKLLQWFNAGLALPNLDVATIIKRAARDLAKVRTRDQEVFIFGFSRGAAIARRFAARINSEVEKYTGKKMDIPIRFLGVFDTVASIGWPNLDDDKKPISDVKFENCVVAPGVKEALHMLSIDEKRTAFMPTLMAHDPGRVTEVWFAGAHSDVGGGYRYDGLSDVTLEFLLGELEARNLGLKIHPPRPGDFQTPGCRELGLAYDDMAIQPNPLGKSHQQDRSFLMEWTLTNRDLRVHVDQDITPGARPMPLIHFSVVERIHGLRDYRPVPLSKRTLAGQVENEILHSIWRPDGETPVPVKGLAEHLSLGPPAPRKLAIGQSRLVTVYANRKMNRSYVYANKGENYYFELDMGQIWFDSGIGCGPGGWTRESEDFPWFQSIPIKFMENERPCPGADWFELLGMVGKRDHKPFQVLQHLSLDNCLGIKDFTGEFFFFANDLEERYGNNLGLIQVKVTRSQ